MKVIEGITLTSQELAHAYRDQLKERQENPEKWRGLQFGHEELDKITGGLRKGEFCVIAGAQKAGKTTVALAWAQRFSRQVQEGEKVLFVSLEMRHESIAARVLANLSGIETSKFRDYKLEDGDWSKLDRGVEEMDTLPVLWNVGAYNIEGIEKIVEEHANEIRVIVVDYFQLMVGDSATKKRFEQFEAISQRLKRLTLTYDLSVVAISQQSREALRSIERQKDPNTLAGTQSLVRDCDLLLLILPYIKDGEEIPHMRKLHIALSRNSGAGVTMDAIFSGAYCRFGAPASLDVSSMPEADPWWD